MPELLDLPGPSRRIVVEPLRAPEPPPEPSRERPPAEPAAPPAPVEEPVPA